MCGWMVLKAELKVYKKNTDLGLWLLKQSGG